jgi:protease IV
MLRFVLLFVLSPFWLPVRGFRYLTSGRRRVDVLLLDVRGGLGDFPRASGWLSRMMGRGSPGLDLLTLVQTLDLATRDPHLKEVVVYVEDLHCGLARAEEVRAALQRVREAGKPVVVYAETLNMDAYWLSLGASDICLMPTGSLSVTGISLEFTLLKGLLDKVGLQAQLGARGKYKSMAEMFTQTELSPANREMLEALTFDLSSQFRKAVANARRLTVEQVDTALASAPLRATQALEFGMVDRLVYADQLRTEREKLRTASLAQYHKRLRARRLLPQRPKQVAVLQVTNNIKSGGHSAGPNGVRRATGSTTFGHALRRVTKSPHVKAVILRVDSPGGSALASDAMWRELNCAVTTLKEKNIPLLVSMVNTAASGGYYVSGLRGVEVWASPLTLTGSIGVVAGKYEISGLLAQLGIKRVAVKSGPRANYYSPSTPWGENELQKLSEDLDAAYQDFVTKMAHARGLSYEQLHDVAQGRVWTGAQALTHGLIDRLGGLYDVCHGLADVLHAPVGELAFWNPDAKGGFKLRAHEQDAPLLGLELGDNTLASVFDALRMADWFGTERTLLLSSIQMRR